MEFMLSFLLLILGLAPLILLIILFVRTTDLTKRIRKLEAVIGSPSSPTEKTAGIPRVPPPGKSPAVPVQAPPVRKKEELEAMIGGKLMNRIGAFALVLGVGFFLKYAFDNDWITETMRVLIGIAAGTLCLLGGYRTHSKGLGIFAQGLVGAGIAILYLSLYASFNFYHLIPQWVAFLFMSLVTVTALGQAVYYNSLAVSILGWAGGFLTPFLLSTGESNEIALFTYTALLALGLLAMTVRKSRWFLLDPLTMAGTYVIYFVWYNTYYSSADLWITIFFLSLFWLLFHATDLVRARLTQTGFREWRHVIQAANAALAYIALYILLFAEFRDALASVTFAMGILYALTMLVSQRLTVQEQGIETRYGLIAAAFLLAGTAVESSEPAIIRLWAIEGFVLLWIGLRSARVAFSRAALVFFGLSAGLFLVARGSFLYHPIDEFALLLNPRALTSGILAASLGAGAILTSRFDDPFARRARPWLGVSFFLVLFLLLTAETNDYFRLVIEELRAELTGPGLRAELSQLQNERQLAMSGLWLGYSIFVMAVGILRSARGPRFLAIGLFGLTILKIFIVDLSFLETLYRIFSFLGLGVILLLVSYLYQRYKTYLFGPESPDQKE